MGMNLNRLHVGNDQQRRVIQRQRVLLQLAKSGIQVFMLALVLPGKAILFPHIGPAIAAAGFLCALLESEPFAMRISHRRLSDAQQITELIEVRMCAAAFFQRTFPPSGDKLFRRHRLWTSHTSRGMGCSMSIAFILRH